MATALKPCSIPKHRAHVVACPPTCPERLRIGVKHEHWQCLDCGPVVDVPPPAPAAIPASPTPSPPRLAMPPPCHPECTDGFCHQIYSGETGRSHERTP